MSDNNEFVIDQKKKVIVRDFVARIERLFCVKVSFTDGGSADGMVWVGLKGQEEQRRKAKDYITAITSPQERCTVAIPPSLISRLGAETRGHLQLEAEYGVVVRYPRENQAVIEGSDIGVTCASSKLENLKCTLGKATENNRALEEFALKLGYEQSDVDAVFDKLGPTVDKNTFLKELINCSKQRSRTVEEKRSPVGRGLQTSGYTRDMFMMHPSEMVAARSFPAGDINHLNGVSSNNRSYLPPEGHEVVARGCVRTRGQTSQSTAPLSGYAATARDYGGVPQNNTYYVTGNDHSQTSSDPRQEEQMFQELLNNGCRYQQFPSSDLRHVVIDGSNVAMSHGNNKVFSCKGIALCVDWFRKRGHTQITVFVPQWRKESPKPESPITDQRLLNQLEDQGYLTFTPSRRINGRRIVCYDDRFIVRLADKTDGIIVSNDNFKDLAHENPKWRDVIDQRLLMYSFVSDMFMPPDDPLGRHGPTLDEFLHKGTSTHRRVCPYGRRCTYGNRCKFHHPEREDKRLQVYQTLKDMFPSQDALILNVMKKYPLEKDAERLAIQILDLSQTS